MARRLGLDGFDGLSRVVDVLDFEVSRGGVTGFHALLQFIVALDLHLRGFDVGVEERVSGGFIADVYGEGPRGVVVVEVETGFVPRDRLDRLEEYLASRLAFKAAAYSLGVDAFIVAFPRHVSVSIPPCLLKPLEDREPEDVGAIRRLIEAYDARRASRIGWRAHMARIDGLASINVDRVKVAYVPLNGGSPILELLEAPNQPP
ncbi:MAG: hypothetical protein P3X22_003190 [Thermoprotei archaeon]|nr:hypothetical protein [Thermoprotei archaeon]